MRQPVGGLARNVTYLGVCRMLFHVCPVCRTQFERDQRVNRCPRCRSFPRFDYSDSARLGDLVDEQFDDIRRYWRLLPLSSPDHPSLQGIGGTPLIRLDLPGAEDIELMAKIETASPVGTGTFKDREAGLVMSRSAELRQTHVCLQSTGNTALAAALAAAKEDICSTVFIPPAARPKLLMPWGKSSSSQIVEVVGSPRDVKAAASRYAAETGAVKVAPWSERSVCNATLAFEAVEHDGTSFD